LANEFSVVMQFFSWDISQSGFSLKEKLWYCFISLKIYAVILCLIKDLVAQVMFICNHCPFVKHLKKDIVKLTNFYMKVVESISFLCVSFISNWTCHDLTNDYRNTILKSIYVLLQKGLAVVAISSNSVATHPQVLINPILSDQSCVEVVVWFTQNVIVLHRMDQSWWQRTPKYLITLSLIYMMRYANACLNLIHTIEFFYSTSVFLFLFPVRFKGVRLKRIKGKATFHEIILCLHVASSNYACYCFIVFS
jgi:hypothetical protein